MTNKPNIGKENINPFIFNEPVVPPIFAGKKQELLYLQNAVFINNDSLVIHGNDAIGKSSLVRTLHKNMIEIKDNNFLPVRINAFDFINAVDQDFLGIVTHQICATIWTKLMQKKYSELIEDVLLNINPHQSKRSEEKTVKRIFKIVTSERLTGTGKTNKEYGGKLYLEGKISHSKELVNIRKPLAPFEFIHLLDELNDIIQTFNYSSIIVLCDELNHFPNKTNTDILRNYFSIFSSKKIQFIIVVVNPEEDKMGEYKKLVESFNYSLEIGPFKNSESVKELIENSIKLCEYKFVFEEGMDKLLFTITNGHPWWIQKICNHSFYEAYNNNENIISSTIINKSFNFFENEINLYNEKIKAGLPFRKFDLRLL